ncbi:MAG: aminotransferase class III-fold pyridoxal phosphate-dependent enzyme [Granulosicoccus sp.]|nr:aminotransferase class III-fold pyridoxal phosphate-dependent enzyme [Granulosicoccus sp.]
MRSTESPNSWEQRDLNHLFHGFSDMQSLHTLGPVVLSHGKGIFVHDVQGKRYLDANSGLWNVIAGFDHPGLIEAVCEQARKFPGYHSFFGRVSDVTVELAEKLVEVSPFDSGKVFFTNSGSEANDTAVKMLWLINAHRGEEKRRKIITRINAYHGVTAVSASMTAKPYNRIFGLPLSGFIHTDCPHHWRFAENGESELEFSNRLADSLEQQIIDEGPESIAGFFAEPVMGAGGVIPPPRGYFAAIQAVLKKYDIPLIADEVITGFGRTGKLWGVQTYDIEPDVIIASKCITAGYFPMGAVILSQAMAEKLTAASKAEEEFAHGFTTAGHPIGCAVALKAIDVIMNEGLLDNVGAVSPYFQRRLQEFESLEYIGEARGVGLMGALEMVSDKATKAPFPSALSVSERVANTALEFGMICRPIGQAVVLCPPFIITKAEIDQLFDALEKTLDKVFSEVPG